MLCYNSSPSSSSQSEDEATVVNLNPTQLLSIAIKKRRQLFSRKERDFRLELLQTGLIQSLCKHLGERRAHRRRRGGKRSSSAPARENKSHEASQEVPIARVEPVVQTVENAPQRCTKRPASVDDADPFCLDEFFASLTDFDAKKRKVCA